jgi:hypothetical protein
MAAKTLHFLLICLFLLAQAAPARALAPVTYYVSAVSGNDINDGLSPSTAFRSINKVNGLALNPGDKVLFACGETWRVQLLTIQRSGSSGSPITFSSNPPGCINKPRLLGTRTVSGWAQTSGNIYTADLTAGSNAGLFPNGINQLFRDGQRLTMGRWPNLGTLDNGYAAIDAQPGGNQLTDNQLPAANWKGATLHLKVIRWSMINRDVTAVSGKTLTLNSSADCWGGSCKGWGYFLNNSLATLDQDGEWYYDKASHKLYLYAAQSPTASNIEASVVLSGDDRNRAAVSLGSDYGDPISYVVVDNLEIRGWFNHGIASPTNLTPGENSFITLSNNAIYDVDDSGINLFTWVYSAQDGLDGWRGGNNITILANQIDGANSFGIHTPSRQTTIQSNLIRNIGLAANLNEAGMGCGKTGGEGACTEDGTGLRIYVDNPANSGYGFTVRYNRFENIGYHGIQTFGASSTFDRNVFDRTCISKGDCGAINTFGSGSSLSGSHVHDLTVTNNIILDTMGNTDGCRSDFKSLFGFGLYYDNNSRNIVSSGNTVIRSTAAAMLYQNSSGTAANNTFYNNAGAFAWGTQVVITGSVSQLTSLTGNIFFVNNSSAAHLQLDTLSQLVSSDNNRFYHAWRADYISANGAKTLAQWKTYSGKDGNSTATTLSRQRMYVIYANETNSTQNYTFDTLHSDLDGNPLPGGLTLAPYTSKILSLISERFYLPVVIR